MSGEGARVEPILEQGAVKPSGQALGRESRGCTCPDVVDVSGWKGVEGGGRGERNVCLDGCGPEDKI